MHATLLKVISFLLLCFSMKANSQYILLKDYNIILTNFKSSPCQDSLTEYTRDDRKIVVRLFDCMGKMYVKVYKNNNLLEEGSYTNSLDTLKGYTYKKKIGSAEREIIVEKYFQPLRDGVWLFYNPKGTVSRKANYRNGIVAE